MHVCTMDSSITQMMDQSRNKFLRDQSIINCIELVSAVCSIAFNFIFAGIIASE